MGQVDTHCYPKDEGEITKIVKSCDVQVMKELKSF